MGEINSFARELKGYGTFVDELCLIMTGFDRGQRVGDRGQKGEGKNWVTV